MSSHDGVPNEESYHPLALGGVEVTPQLLTQQHINTTSLPPQALIMGTQYMPQQQARPQEPHPPAPRPPPPLQQHFNDYYYNTYATQPGQTETYSVLPVGHGNFLKVYHCQDSATSPTGMANDSSGLYRNQMQQQQVPTQSSHQHQHIRQPQPQPSPPQFFNSYELFSSNTLMPTPDNQTALGRNEIKSSTTHASQQAPILLMNKHHEERLLTQTSNKSTTTNMIINKLVNNWSPNVTGAPIQQLPMQTQSVLFNQEPLTCNNVKERVNTNVHILKNERDFIENLTTTTPLIVSSIMSQTVPVLPATQIPPIDEQSTENHTESSKETSLIDVANSSHSNTLSVSITKTHINTTPEGKKRIVAEVKPMRMSYSDVLSKMNNQQMDSAQLYNSNQKTAGKNGKLSVAERKTENTKVVGENGVTRRSMTIGDIEAGVLGRSSKKSPTHENKENIQQLQSNANGKSNNRAGNGNATANANISITTNNTQQRKGQRINQKASSTLETNSANNGINKSNNNNSKKRLNSKRTEMDLNKNDINSGKTQKSNGEKDYNGYYNVAAKNYNDGSGERASKSTNNGFIPMSTTSTRKSNKSTTSFNNISNTSSSFSTNQSRTRYSNNANSNSSYSYLSKRSRNTNSSYGSMSAGSTNRNYELAKKFLRAWLEYTIKILTWLFYLLYDIVVLGCSVAYDRLVHACECGIVYAKQLRRDIKENSNKPSIWLKNFWRKFDSRFKKNSHWAFWRRFYQKKPPEPTMESMKTGRLPQTGEEAMYSLLNCKGKDAYSILGVPPDSSQEQIRKHYKKIAVLVHPDKNKQAGAEEAFKILQRAFELIGEPEKRLAYDQSLAEALHAEKAWTELHDLISQLQTKITEAANTIRCSTCGLRHPRRLTDRRHYAARECASCKIRHSAREGDIWAETSMFGLRWRYLALMEGKVYDITEWANCQKGALAHLEPNSHMVQYRIVRGAQQQQQQQQQQHHQQQPSAYSHHSPHHQNSQQPYTQQPGSHHDRNGTGKFKRNIPPSEASLHEFLDNLYSGQHPNSANSSTAYSNPSRRRTRRN